MNFKDGKWAKKILEMQLDDGSWGYFHTLHQDKVLPITTEQALRRLEILGFNSDDKPIKKALKYMHNCLTGKICYPDREEKFGNWHIGRDFILATWIRIFSEKDNVANDIALKWVDIINYSFKTNKYDYELYKEKYIETFGVKTIHQSINIFYLVSLVTNMLDKEIEKYYYEYILDNDKGVYYVYDKKLKIIPNNFNGKETSRYLSGIELMAKFNDSECKKQLKFIENWLNKNMIKMNKWDTGKDSKDGINYPLSDSWRTENDRIEDCTYRIEKLLKKIKANCNFT
jgi:hypothetical protein